MTIVSIILGMTVITAVLAMSTIVNYRRRQNKPQEFSAEREISRIQQEAEVKKKELNRIQGGLMQDSPAYTRPKKNSNPLKDKQIGQLAHLIQRLSDKK